MKKIIFTLGLTFLLLSQNAYAAEKAVLDTENFDGDGIVRLYEMEDGALEYLFIKVPDDLIDTVRASEDSLLEAKKQLTAAYTLLDLKRELSILNGEFYPKRGEIELEIPFDKREKYIADQRIVQEYTNERIANWNTLSDIEKEKEFDKASGEYIGFDEAVKIAIENEKNSEQDGHISELVEEVVDEENKITKEENDTKEDKVSVVSIIIGVLVTIGLFILVVIAIRKRR